MKKRIMSMLVVLTIVFSLIVVPNSATASTFYDTVDTDCELAVDVLSALGIMGGYTDGSFLPYNTITRAEMAAIAVKLAGIEGYPDTAPDDMNLFNDMYDYDGWAGGVIAMAKAAGIARSDENGNFNPDMSATYEDAMQMVVSALGYAHQAISRGDKLTDYVYVAQKLGLTKKLSTAMGQNITRSDVAKLVYAALTVDIMEGVSYSVDGTVVEYRAVEGKNALNTYFDVYEVNGIITENEYAAIDGETTVDEEQVLINGEAFEVGSTDIYSYLGYYATVYALEGDDVTENRKIIAYNVKNVKNNTITVLSENIDSVDSEIGGYVYNYWNNKDTDKKTKRIDTSATPLVLYNGKAVVDVTTNLLVPENGHVVFIDNNGDDQYDIIDIWEYDLVYVFSASQASGNVTGYYDRSTTYRLDPESEDYHVTFLNSQGGMAQLSDIKQYSVLYVYQSLDNLEKKVVISNNKINGTITEATADDEYTINGVEYKLSPAAKGKLELAASDTGDFYLDADMRIVGFEGTTVIRKNIGMFIAINDGGLARGYQVKLLTQNSGVRIMNLASSIKVNDEKISSDEFYELAYTDALFGTSPDPKYASAGLSRPHPARAAFLYKVNSKDEICEVTVVGENDTYLQTRQIKTAGYLYYSKGYKCLHYSGELFYDESLKVNVGVRTYCDDSTINFLVEEAAAHTDENRSFYTKYMNTYSDNYNYDLYDYCYAYYYSPDGSEIDMQKTVCNFLVMANWYDDSVDSTEDLEQNTDARNYQDNTPIKFIHKVTQAVDRASGEQTVRVYYYDGTSLRNSLVRPQYYRAGVGLLDNEFYPSGYPVRISTDGSYIEDIAPYFSELYADMNTMVAPIYDAGAEAYVMPIQPFYQEQRKAWNYWSRNSTYYSRFYCGMVTSIDEVVGRKLFSVAYAIGGSISENPADSSYVLAMLPNERLEGTVYRMNLDRDGNIASFTRGTLDDIAPGQLVIIRKRAYDRDPKWEALTGYAMHEIIIVNEDVSELDYLETFYNQVQEEYINVE